MLNSTLELAKIELHAWQTVFFAGTSAKAARYNTIINFLSTRINYRFVVRKTTYESFQNMKINYSSSIGVLIIITSSSITLIIRCRTYNLVNFRINHKWMLPIIMRKRADKHFPHCCPNTFYQFLHYFSSFMLLFYIDY